MWINAIFDRTRADVDLIRLDPTNSNSKGAYNYEDLNRIENNCIYIANILNNADLFNASIEIQTRTDWTMQDIPTLTELNRIRGNVKLLIEAIESPNAFEEIEFTNTMDYIKANVLEKDLHLLKTYIETFGKIEKECNTFYAGFFGLHGKGDDN